MVEALARQGFSGRPDRVGIRLAARREAPRRALRGPKGGSGGGGSGGDGWGGGGGGGGGEPLPPAQNARLAICLLLALPVVAFVVVLGGYLLFEAWAPAWRRPEAPGLAPFLAVGTALMIAAAATLDAAVHAARARRRASERSLGIAAGAGLLFLGVEIAGWRALFAGAASAGTRSFFALTGVHAALVAGGLGALAFFMRRPRRAQSGAPIQLCRAYWHALALLWLGLMTLVFFAGPP